MGECKKGIYKDNFVVTRKPLMCYGGFGQPKCEYVKECFKEHKKRVFK